MGARTNCCDCTDVVSVGILYMSYSYSRLPVRSTVCLPYPLFYCVYRFLESKKLKSVPVDEAAAKVENNKAVLVDIRTKKEFDRQHAAGAINVPLFRAAETQSPGMTLKRIAYAGLFLDVTGTRIKQQERERERVRVKV